MLIPTTVLTQTYGQWQTYTPALTASVSNPVLGTGGTAFGRYLQIGTLCNVEIQISFGSSGVSAGSGIYYVSVPVSFGASAFTYARVGTVLLFDSSTVAVRLGMCERDSSNNRLEMYADGLAAAATLVTESTPWAWAANDQIHLVFTYESTTP